MAFTQWMADQARDFRRKTWAPTKTRGHSKRAIMKNGYTNVIRKKLSPNRRWRYLQDIFTTLLDAQWRWTLQFLALCFFGCWLAFSLIWWLIAFVHGDLHEDHLPIKQPETGWTPCVLNIHGFHSCFLYSLETQHTTGYGLRAITEECPEAIFVLCFQCIIGMMIDSFTVGIVFAKMVRSKMATYTIQFSRNAVVSRRDDKLCLMFRVGDIRRSNLVGVTLTGILIKSERTSEDDVLENYQTGLSLKVDDGDNNLVLLWPMTAYHVIDQDSPLFKMSAVDMLREEFEIVVILSATVESTGASAEAKSSYLSNEILWGRNFVSVVSFDAELDSYEVDWSCFDRTASVETPRTSAADQSENLPELNPDKLQNQNRPASEEDFSTARERLVRADQADEEELLLSFINSEASSSVPRIRKPQCTLHNYFRNCEVPQTINENEELVELSLV
ncbi:ATP-sensitive inward rectifier potassium channel 1-like [Cylas formicarius]|uniref:ATP-sensitive inward rectifier potassium channel 1-like n=1 Tax=Cylas formicarius TaxID=197179 RepID=UPI002958DD1F|nr:ATP-sensitive inward rectifier potassium channel 1-like [Cylas formicarius]